MNLKTEIRGCVFVRGIGLSDGAEERGEEGVIETIGEQTNISLFK